ncbi:MAG: outer membrane protein transport protein, partial [Planctomycetales bacterium]
ATLLNIQVPGIAQHVAGVGATMQMNRWLDMSVAYVHTFKSEIAQGPVAEIPGTNVGFDLEADSLILGMSVKFGPCRECTQQDCSCGGSRCSR